MIISSSSNERVKQIQKLIKSSKERSQRGQYIVEGIRMFREIPKEAVEAIYVAESQEEKFLEEIKKYDMEYIILSDKIFREISDTGTPQGILAIVNYKPLGLEDLILRDEKNCIIIVERLQDPGNMGTIIRTSEGAGITGIMISSDSVDIYNPKVVRSTMGSIFRVPIYISDNLVEDIETLKRKKIVVYGAHLDGKDLYENSFLDDCAFLIGNEGNGLSNEVSKKVDKLLRIPMKGMVESLNAATSVAVIGYEVLRQRMK